MGTPLRVGMLVAMGLLPLAGACGTSGTDGNAGSGGTSNSEIGGAAGVISGTGGATASAPGTGGQGANASAGGTLGTGGAGVGGGAATGGTTGVADAGLPTIDPNLAVETLTDAQKGELCDWMMQELGGYGSSYDCGGGVSNSTPADQAACIKALVYRCSVTVGQVETCYLAAAPTRGCVFVRAHCYWLYCE